MPTDNFLLMGDSYKFSHYLQFPKGTRATQYYIESRGGKYAQTLFFGLQYFIKRYLLTPITQAHINEAEAMMLAHGLPFNRTGFEIILNEYQGYMPVTIKAVPEGTMIPILCPLLTVENTDDRLFWLPGFIETALLRAIWYPTTVATVSNNIKSIINNFLLETADDNSGLAFKLHDFGSRGVSCAEAAAIGGLAHLVNFKGTDTVSSLKCAKEYYGADDMPAFSIPAAEHSTIIAWLKDNEKACIENLLDLFCKPNQLVSILIDTYDTYNCINHIIGSQLKDKIINSGGTLVVRPDSGDPIEVNAKIIEMLGVAFGTTTNSKGYKLLNHVRIIQGDQVNENSIMQILNVFKQNKWSADNIAFGMGAALLQQVNRDTQKFAMKCNAIKVNNEWVGVNKSPITDLSKSSKKGYGIQSFCNDANEVSTIFNERGDLVKQSLFRVIYQNGVLLIDDSLEIIRKRLIE